MATTTPPKARIARIQGKFLAPGISKNRRLYTKAAISNAVEAMNTQIADPAAKPIAMMAHHPTFPGGDSRAIVGKVTKVDYDPASGVATYEADVPDTDDGRTLLGLTTPGADGKRYLNNVSIRGAFTGPVETKVIDGQQVSTCDDLEVYGIDFTQDPGVDETGITKVILEEAARQAGGHQPIVEVAAGAAEVLDPGPDSADGGECRLADGVCVTCTDEAANALTAGSDYADPGYQKDKKKRYPLDSERHIRAAWAFINRAENQEPYTAAQLKRIKQRIRAAAKKDGINIAAKETADAVAALVESYAAVLPEAARAGFLQEAYASVSVGNGPADINVSAYGNDPADLQAVIGRLSAAVVAALDAVDPDGDGDIDLPGDKDGGAGWRSGESAPGANQSATSAANQKGAPTVSTENKPAEGTEATHTETLTAETVAEMVKTGVAAALEAAGVAPKPAETTETAAGVEATNTEQPADRAAAVEAMKAQMRDEVKKEVADEIRKELVESGIGIGRKGHVRQVAETAEDMATKIREGKATREEIDAYANEAWAAVLGH